GVLNKDIYACPNSIAVPEFKVGEFSESGLKLEREMWPEKLGNKLKGMCSPKNCEYNQFCQGGCRGFVWTYTKDFYGSPPFCLTKILDALALEQ
ncbi:MAG: SPASM domain-containing protein, partial [Promethearchaeota archaeon]